MGAVGPARLRGGGRRSSWVEFQAATSTDCCTSRLTLSRFLLNLTADLESHVPHAGAYVQHSHSGGESGGAEEFFRVRAQNSGRSLLRCVKPGGIIVFHEFDFPDPHPSYPPCPLFDQVYMLVGEVFRRGGAPPDFGRRLGKTLLDAGLPFPTIAAEIIIGGGAGSYVYPWLANTLISVAPRLAQLGLSLTPDVAADHTLAGRMEEEAVRLGSQLLAPAQFGAWTRKP